MHFPEHFHVTISTPKVVNMSIIHFNMPLNYM